MCFFEDLLKALITYILLLYTYFLIHFLGHNHTYRTTTIHNLAPYNNSTEISNAKVFSCSRESI